MFKHLKKSLAVVVSFVMAFTSAFLSVPAVAKADATKTVTIYFQKPDSWANAYIWYRSDDNEGSVWDTTTVGQAPGNMTAVPNRKGWYEKTITTPNEVTFLFNDGTWNNKLDAKGFNSSASGNNFTTTTDVWYTKDGTQHSTDPYVPSAAEPFANPGSETFSTSTLDITLDVDGDNVAASKYTLDGSDPSASGVSYTPGQTITIGASLSTGQSETLRLYAKNDIGENTATYTYTKVDKLTKDAYNNLRIYQIMVASFKDGDPSIGYKSLWGAATIQDPGGDLQGIIDSMSYIKGTGCNAIWLTPVFDSTGSEQVPSGTDPIKDNPYGDKLDATGYYTTNYFKVDPHFGTEAKLKELINDAHSLGMYVFFDGVFGHCSKNVKTVSPSGNNLVLWPGASEYKNDATGGNIDVADSMPFLKEVATYWMDEVGVDGWRVDQAYQVKRDQWSQIYQAVQAKAQQRKAAGDQWGTLGYMVAEDWDGSRGNIINNIYGPDNNPGLDSSFSFPVQPIFDSVFVNGGSPSQFNSAFAADAAQYPSHAKPNLFIDNHDMRRFGNQLNSNGTTPDNPLYWSRFKEAISMLGESTGPVTMFYNTEIGAKCPDAYLNNWSGITDDTGRFNANTTYSSLNSNQKDLYDYTSKVMNLKASNSALWDGTRSNLIANDSIYADLKYDSLDNNEVLYVLDNSAAQTVTIPQSEVNDVSTITDGITGDTFTASGGNFNIAMSADSARFLIVNAPKHSDASLTSVDDNGAGVTIPAGASSPASVSTANINVTVPTGYTVAQSKFTAKDSGTVTLYSDSAFTNKITGTITVNGTTPVYVKVTSQDASTSAYWSVTYSNPAKHTDAVLSAVDSNSTDISIPAGAATKDAAGDAAISAQIPKGYTVDPSKFKAADNGTVSLYSDSAFSTPITSSFTVTAPTTIYVKVTSEDGSTMAYWSLNYSIVILNTDAALATIDDGGTSATIPAGATTAATVANANVNVSVSTGYTVTPSKFTAKDSGKVTLYSDSGFTTQLYSVPTLTKTTTIYVKVTSQDGLTNAYWSVTYTILQKTVTVYIQKPTSWNSVYIWYRSDDTASAWDTTVLGAAPGILDATTHSGWYAKTITTPNEATFLFNDGTWNNKLDTTGYNHTAAGNNFTATTDVWITNDGKLSTTNPWVGLHTDATLASVDDNASGAVIPTGASSISNVTGSNINVSVTSGYTVDISKFTAADNGNVALYSDSAFTTPVTNNLALTSNKTIYVKVTSEDSQTTAYWSVTYTVSTQQITIYLQKPSTWSKAYIWYKSDAFASSWDTTVLAADPGTMTAVSGHTGWYAKTINTPNYVTFLFNDGTWTNKLDATGYNHSAAGNNFTTTDNIWVTNDGKASTSDPWVPLNTDAKLAAIDDNATGVAIPAGAAAVSGALTANMNVAVNTGYSVTPSKFTAADSGTVSLYADSAFSTQITGSFTVTAPKTIYVKVTSQDGVTSVYYSVTYTLTTKAITIYFQQPTSWSNAYIWYRSDDNEGSTWDTTVLGAAPGGMTAVSGHSGWYSKTVTTPNEVTFLFNDGTWKNKLDTTGYNHSATGNNFTAKTDVWVTNDGKLNTANPWG